MEKNLFLEPNLLTRGVQQQKKERGNHHIHPVACAVSAGEKRVNVVSLLKRKAPLPTLPVVLPPND